MQFAPKIRPGRVLVLTAFLAFSALLSAHAEAQTGPYQFYPLTPCRAVDTRIGQGGYSGMLLNGQVVGFVVKGVCGIPVDAAAVSFNITIADTQQGGWFALYPSDKAYAGVSSINFNYADTIANGAIVPLATSGAKDVNALAAFAPGSQGANLILDVTGYFK